MISACRGRAARPSATATEPIVCRGPRAVEPRRQRVRQRRRTRSAPSLAPRRAGSWPSACVEVDGGELDRERARRVIRPRARCRAAPRRRLGRGLGAQDRGQPAHQHDRQREPQRDPAGTDEQLLRRRRATAGLPPAAGAARARSFAPCLPRRASASARSALARAAIAATSSSREVKAAHAHREAVLGQQQPDAALPGRDLRGVVARTTPSPGRGSCPRPAACCSATRAGTRTGRAARTGTTSAAGFCVAAHTITPGRAAARDEVAQQLGERGALLAVLGVEVEGELVARHQVQRRARRPG